MLLYKSILNFLYCFQMNTRIEYKLLSLTHSSYPTYLSAHLYTGFDPTKTAGFILQNIKLYLA